MRRRKLAGSTDDLPIILLALAQRGWTVADLAQATECDVSTLHRWLQGAGAISQTTRDAVLLTLCLETSEA